MTKLSLKNEATLKAVLKLGKATVQDINDFMGHEARPAIKSLNACNLIETISIVRRVTKVGHNRDMCVYAITEKGRQKLLDADLPPARKMKDLKVPIKRPQPMKSPPPPKETNMHQMQSFIVPMPITGHKVMMAEIDGRTVKITYGACFEYEVYRPAPDRSRNYTPRPIKGIHAL